MVRLLALLALTASLAVPAAASARSHTDGAGTLCVLRTALLAQNEVPPTNSQAFGAVQITVRTDNSIEFVTVIVNPANENFIAGHIHGPAPVGMNAPVLVPLPITATHQGLIVLRGVVSHVDPHLIANLCANPSNYYVNYHTTALPTGAIRGQLG